MDLIAQGTQGFAEFLDSKSGDNKWTLQGSWRRKVRDKRLESLFNGNEDWSGYQLVLNSEWSEKEKVDFEGQGVKGALSLAKNNWVGKDKGGKKVEEWSAILKSEKEKDAKVWLIIAQGEDAMYLIPVVRFSGWWGKYGCEEGSWKEMEGKAIESGKNGIDQIGQWSTTNDRKSIWEKEQDKRLQEKMNGRFSITRKIDSAIYEIEVGRGISDATKVEKYAVQIKEGDLSKKIKEIDGFRYVGKNSGILKFGERTCIASETYFPLDLVILSNSGETKSKIETTIDKSKKEQTIKITDKIEQVIGVRLD